MRRCAAGAAAGPRSFFEIYRRLITLRHESPVLQLGDFAMLEPEHPTLDAFTRSLSDKTLTVVGHYSREPLELPFAVGATW